ncbi:hypothetical protein EG68_02416 [Paragonimus skrjabini miyazakii]|uniref:Uncharacterized protein n=1 Tax=Paragonimus skrjabini miyazakii TaxID=59628 RepID=A0A8S9YBM7_9TREM|nr:hypothetical protein EG68_02416 [Paragonimus skrjabini miyazakii]
MVSGRELRLASDTLLPTDNLEPLLTTEHIHQMHSSLVRGHQLARSHQQAAQRHQKAFFDRRVHGTQYQPGDKVWLYDAVPPPGIPSKLHKQWKGPAAVVRLTRRLADGSLLLPLARIGVTSVNFYSSCGPPFPNDTRNERKRIYQESNHPSEHDEMTVIRPPRLAQVQIKKLVTNLMSYDHYLRQPRWSNQGFNPDIAKNICCMHLIKNVGMHSYCSP